MREHDASLVCAHSLPTKLEDFATSRLRYRPGEETATLLLLLRALADAKAQNLDFIIKHTTGFAAFKTALDRLDSAALAKRAGLEWDDVRRAAAQLAAAKRLVVVLGQQALAAAPEDNAGLALDLLTMLGGVEHGLLLTSDRNDAWGALLALQAAGVAPATFREVVEAGMNGRLNSLLVFGGDPLVSAPYAESLRKAMEVTGFVVAADAFLNRTAESANVFLPTQVFAERDGHVISAEGRLLRLRRAIEADENTLPESRIAAELARRLGRPLSENSPAAVWRELLTKNAALAATDAQAASRAGSLLPPFALRAESKIAFGAAPKPAEPVAGEMILVTGPVLFHNGALSTRAAGTREVCPGPWIAQRSEFRGAGAAGRSPDARCRLRPASLRRISRRTIARRQRVCGGDDYEMTRGFRRGALTGNPTCFRRGSSELSSEKRHPFFARDRGGR